MWDEKLDAVGRGAVKTVQSRCRLVAHHRARSESEEAGHQSLLNRWWRTDQAPDTRGNPIQQAISHPPVQLVSRHLEPVECLAVDDSVVLGKKLSDFVPLAHSSMGVARSEEGKRRFSGHQTAGTDQQGGERNDDAAGDNAFRSPNRVGTPSNMMI